MQDCRVFRFKVIITKLIRETSDPNQYEEQGEKKFLNKMK